MSLFKGGFSWWLVLGFSAQLLFSLRFIVQWIASERHKASTVPVSFWYLSIVGGSLLLVYAVHTGDPVFILGQATGVVIYLRNLVLIRRQRGAGPSPAA